MAIPRDKESRRFFFVAQQRREDAEFLFKNQRFLGAMYLAGYTVECVLKSLLLANSTKGERKEIVLGFKGKKAHDLEDLRRQVLPIAGGKVPQGLAEAFARVASWKPDLRYEAGRGDLGTVRVFLDSVDAIFEWAKGRL